MPKNRKKLKKSNYKLSHRSKELFPRSAVDEKASIDLQEVAWKSVMLGVFACFSFMTLVGLIWFTSSDGNSVVSVPIAQSIPDSEVVSDEFVDEEISELVPVAGGVYSTCRAETTKGGWMLATDGATWNVPGVGEMDPRFRIPSERQAEFVKYWNGVVKKMNSMTRYKMEHRSITQGKPFEGVTINNITTIDLTSSLDSSTLTSRSCVSSLTDPSSCAVGYDPSTTIVQTHPRKNNCTYSELVTNSDGSVDDRIGDYNVNTGREALNYRKYNPVKIMGLDDDFSSYVVGIDIDPKQSKPSKEYGKGIEIVYIQKSLDVDTRYYLLVKLQNGVVYEIVEYGPGILESTYSYKLR